MLIIVTAATVAGWLALWAVLAVHTSAAWARTPAATAPQPAGTESPAVVSLLAGRLSALGYQATLLDLAARGWFRFETRPGAPVMCVLAENRPADDLTGYERRVYAHLVTRAGGRQDIPVAALSDGFADPAGGEGDTKTAKDSFMEMFVQDVIEDSRRRGLTRQRLSNAGGCLLWLAAFVPAIATGLMLRADGSHAYWIPVVGLIALWTLTGLAVKGEKLTPAGQAVLRGWRDLCARQAAAAAPAPGRPHREVAYAAALGKARAMVKLFADTHGTPQGKAIWSSYGGGWRQITIGDPKPRSVLDAGGTLMTLVAILPLMLLPPTVAGLVLAHGALRAALLGVLAVDAVIWLSLFTRYTSIPAFAEFDGRVIEAWKDEETHGENSRATYLCLAIDDGMRDSAWAFAVSPGQYRRFAPGALVHAQVNPRRNTLLDIQPVRTSPHSRS